MALKQSDLTRKSNIVNRPDKNRNMSKMTTEGGVDALRRCNKQRKTVHNGVSDPGGKPPDP